ncbi:MAG: AAA family ATPase [Desulfobacterales bacterium]|nr:AAA family ATPase [Desulfobacterales bacterium]MDJ0882835.1 AAA family ATPase [Desulfobacterales bacterium]
MPFSIAMAGKGGTGKTTMAGLLIKYLMTQNKTPVLAVDADANANLNEVLGVPVTDTLGDAREEMKKGQVPSGMTKDIFMDMRMQQAIIEHDGFDLIVMGQPEGAGCYCAANSLLAGFLEKLTDNYPYLVMDNEAGMEHISRLTTRDVDILLIVADASRRGLQAGLRINDLVKTLNIGVRKTYLMINQAKGEPPPQVMALIDEADLDYVGTVLEDETLYEYDLDGKPTIEMPPETPAVSSAFAIFNKIMA